MCVCVLVYWCWVLLVLSGRARLLLQSDAQDKQPEHTRTEEDATALSAAVWRAVWPRQRLQQRAFFTFGQKMLLALDLQVGC